MRQILVEFTCAACKCSLEAEARVANDWAAFLMREQSVSCPSCGQAFDFALPASAAVRDAKHVRPPIGAAVSAAQPL